MGTLRGVSKSAANPPDLQTIAGRLRWAREAWGLPSTRAAAQRFGWNENTYKSHEGGLRGAEGFKEKVAKKYARAFGVSAAWLMTGAGSPQLHKKSPAEQEWEGMTAEDRELALKLLQTAKSG